MREDSPSRLNATITAIIVGVYVVGIETSSMLGRRGHGRRSLCSARDRAGGVVVTDGSTAVVFADMQGGERRRRWR